MKEKKRELWEVWKDGLVWRVQCPRARVHFFSKKTAMEFSRSNKELDQRLKPQKSFDEQVLEEVLGDI